MAKKYLGAILSAVGCLVYIGFFIILAMLDIDCPFGLKIFLGLMAVMYIILFIWLLARRMKEIQKGEVEDAVSKY